MILAFRIFILALAVLFTVAVLVGRWLRRSRKAQERAEVDAELRRVWVYHICELKQINLPEARK